MLGLNQIIVRLAVVLAFAGIFLNLGCSTLRPDRFIQKVLVKSKPRGAEVFVNGEPMGTTPIFVDVKRGPKDKEIKLKIGEQESLHPLKSRFRWLDSGLSNFVFFGLYPIALATDLASKSAWQVEKEIFYDFRLKPEKTGKTLIIAPPQGANFDLSEEVANALEEYIKKYYSDLHTLSLDGSYKIFRDHHYDFYERPTLEKQKKLRKYLSHQLLGDYIVESFYEFQESQIQIYYEIVDLVTGEIIEKHNTSLPGEKIKKFTEGLWENRAGKAFNIIPNNVALMLTSRHTELRFRETPSSQESTFTATELSMDGWMGEASKALNSFSLEFLRPPTERRSLRYEFFFVPSLLLAWSRFEFESPSLLNGVEFESKTLGGGYGPQWNLVSSWGRLFFELIPTLYYNDLRWRGTTAKAKSFQSSSLGVQTRFGYNFFINKNINFTFFVQSSTENTNSWQRVLDDLSGSAGSVKLRGSSREFVGFALGYYFRSFENPVRKIYE